MLDNNSSISKETAMKNHKIEVYNYLDMHAVINNSIIKVLSIKKLQKSFPEIDEFTLKSFEADWRTARQRMLNLKLDKGDFK